MPTGVHKIPSPSIESCSAAAIWQTLECNEVQIKTAVVVVHYSHFSGRYLKQYSMASPGSLP